MRPARSPAADVPGLFGTRSLEGDQHATAREQREAPAAGDNARHWSSKPVGPAGSGRTADEESLVFDSVYETYLPYVWRTLARMGVPEPSVEDAAQEVFIVVHRQLGDFEGRSTLKTWLFSITFRVAQEWLRRARRTRSATLPAEVSDERCPGPYEGAVRSQAIALLYQLLTALEPEKRAVFIMGELEQMSIPEIAEALGANANTVASRLRKARREFDAAVRRLAVRERGRSP
ncbi:MAG: sigma-70 family RNA polymerase sigma factor [Polyangiaceae bacterium]|nr:sigma-70 family RNA polymerase sigma factor [Polyangiaceae bacterium]